MIKIPVDTVFFTQNISAGRPGEFGKSLTANGKTKLTYLGHGVLVEHPGMKDKLIPTAQILTIEASDDITPEQWGGGGFAGMAYSSGEPEPKSASFFVPVKVKEETQTQAPADKKRGPGRPAKT